MDNFWTTNNLSTGLCVYQQNFIELAFQAISENLVSGNSVAAKINLGFIYELADRKQADLEIGSFVI